VIRGCVYGVGVTRKKASGTRLFIVKKRGCILDLALQYKFTHLEFFLIIICVKAPQKRLS